MSEKGYGRTLIIELRPASMLDARLLRPCERGPAAEVALLHLVEERLQRAEICSDLGSFGKLHGRSEGWGVNEV